MNVFDRKYCIVDNVGNYYGVNEYDALVVAKDEASAQWFDILEANKRINNSGMSTVLRTVAVNRSVIKEYSYSAGQTDDENQEFCMEELNLVRLAKELSFVQANMTKYQKKLKEQQTVVDEEICDVLHFIELYQHDDEQSLELVDRIQNCRKKRREIKDEYFKIETFARIFTPGGMVNLLKDINKQMDHMKFRDYTPRRLPQLFVQAVKQADIPEETYEINGADEYMEETNCNVAQGYMIYKQLKKLRLTRKEKMAELDKVRLIADCFDCEAIAETYRSCLEVMTVAENEKAAMEIDEKMA